MISNHSAIQNISSIHDFILSLIHLNTQFISIPSLSSAGHHPPTPKKGSHFVVEIRQRLVRSGFLPGEITRIGEFGASVHSLICHCYSMLHLRSPNIEIVPELKCQNVQNVQQFGSTLKVVN